ncbi:succinoglycan biosynthesis protein exoi [Pararhizobium sp. BT-229]|uniref:sunset domain-containing protein n=1 Tax=Pararhizobium sp. BT-229 TaxID=2986923 RepID=UPI0021F6C99F|nr:succinoglycan biosynthesis protein exoi [Pararhizobium sp. BT-229]
MRNRRHQPRPQPRSLFAQAPGLFLGLVALGVASVYSIGDWSSDPSQLLRLVDPTCDIKGNISINSRERIYHVPGQKYYSETRIRHEYGERWFCSEQEAREAGWRRAYR